MPDSQPDPLRTGPHVHEPSRSLDRTVDRSNTRENSTGEATAAPSAIPGYKLLGELGRGGMGVVYRAKQISLNREVALKTILRADLSRGTVARFWAEAEVMAAVKHPHVVQVYELGEHAGRPYMAMEYVAGGSLADLLNSKDGRAFTKARPLSPREAAKLVEKIARGVAAAHELGVVHRDLKPGNVLLDANGEPKVADFGLAKRRSADLTQTQAMMGTPAYMAPEQAAGRAKFVGPPADVWALGVILYECISGNRPFTGDTAQVLLSKIQTTEPTALRTRVRNLPRDLDTIVAKCLTKEADGRYATAGELADDLARFLRSEPIAARPVSTPERLLRWAKRKPMAAAAYGVSVLAVVLAVVTIVIAGLWRQAERAKSAADDARADEARLRGVADDAKAEAVHLKEIADAGRKEEGRLRGIADKALEGEAAAKKEVVFQNYAHTVDLAIREYRANNFTRAQELLDACPVDLRGWEWHYINRLCHGDLVSFVGHTDSVLSAVFTREGREIVTISADHTARVWDAETGKQAAILSFNDSKPVRGWLSPDGRRVVATSDDGPSRVWDVYSGKQVAVFKGNSAAAMQVSFSLDGRRILTTHSAGLLKAGDTASVWDADSGNLVALLKGHTSNIGSVAISPDGRRAVTSAGDGTIRVWDTDTGKELAKSDVNKNFLFRVVISSDRKQFVTLEGSLARVWDTATCKQIALLRRDSGTLATRTLIISATFSPDGKLVATTSLDGTAQTWDSQSGRLLAVLSGHTDQVTSAAFSPNGELLVTASFDKTARVWETASGRLVAILPGHLKGIMSASFSSDGRRIVTAGDKTARLWALQSAAPPLEPPILFRPIMRVAFSPSERQLVALSPGQNPIAWDLDEVDRVVRLEGGHTGPVTCVDYSPDGRFIVTTSKDGTARVWDAQSGKQISTLKGHTNWVIRAVFSQDGRRLATAAYDGTARIWDASSGRELAILKGHTNVQVHSVAFSSDGRRVVTTSADRTARVWDAVSGKQLSVLPGGVRLASFSGDGRRILTAAEGNTAIIWDAETSKEIAVIKGHSLPVDSATFSPDGQRIITASRDRTVRLWDGNTGMQMLILPGEPGGLCPERFSSDGSRIVAASLAINAPSESIRVIIYDSRPVNRAFVKTPPSQP
jgi:WD40 repeat protein/predicted Ser/Thr protein kinase